MRLRATALLPAVAAALVVGLVVAPTGAGAVTPEWNVARIGGPVGGQGVLVAVVDTGVDAGHPTFAGHVLPAIDLVGGNGGDPNGHGTHVAGTLAGGHVDPGIGVAPGVRILPVRVLGADGSGSSSTVAEGIRRAADAGAAVINLSLGPDVVIKLVAGSGVDDAIHYAWDRGSVPVLAAGNDGMLGALFGSGYGGLPAVVVTATGPDDRVAPYATSIGSADWGIAAPGGDGSGQAGRDILSSVPGGYALAAGTSMATPHVAASLAVLRGLGLTPAQAVDRLLSTARPLGSQATYGAGLVDLAAATAGLVAAPAGPPAPAPGPTAPAPSTAAAPARSSPSQPVDSSGAETTTEPAPTSVPAGAGGDPVAAPEVLGSRGLRSAEDSSDPPTAAVVLAAAACAAAWIATTRAVMAARRG